MHEEPKAKLERVEVHPTYIVVRNADNAVYSDWPDSHPKYARPVIFTNKAKADEAARSDDCRVLAVGSQEYTEWLSALLQSGR